MTVESGTPKAANRRRWLSLVGVALVVVAFLWLSPTLGTATPAESVVVPVPEAGAPPAPPREEQTDIVQEPTAPAEFGFDTSLDPADVLDNLECRMQAGRGVAGDVAVVVLPTDGGAKFSVVDGEGAVADGFLPFDPHSIRLGRRKDGVPVVGLGDLRLNSGTFRPPESPAPVRIYMGEQVVYESEKVYNFRIARDGTSFAVHEPLAGDASRLVVHNLDLRTERHFDLGTRLTPENAYDPGHTMRYTLDGTEVMFWSTHADSWGNGDYWFYPAGEGSMRHIVVSGVVDGDSPPARQGAQVDGVARRIVVENGAGATLISSREGYFVERPDDLTPDEYGHVWRVAKRTFDFEAGETVDVWQRRVNLRSSPQRRSVSNDGRWLAIGGLNFHLFDAETGRVAFTYPKVGHHEEQLARLASVVGENATTADLGRLGGINFVGGYLAFKRTFGNLASCATPPGEEYDDLRWRQCVGDLRRRGNFRTVYDLFELDAITLDSQPVHRVENYRGETTCVAGSGPLGGLGDAGGRLVYEASF